MWDNYANGQLRDSYFIMYNWGSAECSALAATRGQACARGDFSVAPLYFKVDFKGFISFKLRTGWSCKHADSSVAVVSLISVLIIARLCVVYKRTDKPDCLYLCANDKAIFLRSNDYPLQQRCLGRLVFAAKPDNFEKLKG